LIEKIKNLFLRKHKEESENYESDFCLLDRYESSPFYKPNATPEEVVHNVFLFMGFSGSLHEAYHNDNILAYNYASVGKDSVYLKMRSKQAAFNDSGTIGPPLPNAQELIAFICYEGVFPGDEDIIHENLKAFLGPIKGLK
jgi:hypothetical protein